ncbi:RcpC/CpaB family pilus assembly protein [Gorillibacterium timonense]|uniref:RcpC/CpaB family pilus assembly protein n=1 Tax=Gorillibacterium timonense TaxID=1689269 RepID=UPI0011DDF536|nr:SAF domain-containing protein [Gorillibacterium timonense]
MALSVLGYLLFMNHLEHSKSTVETLMPVRTLLSGEVVDVSLLHSVTVSSAAHRADAVMDPNELIGKQVVVPIGRDEEFAAWKLSEVKLTPMTGERYYSFKTDAATNVNNMVRRGDRVDVWVEWKGQTSDQREERITAVKIIESLPVAGVKTAEGVEVGDKFGVDSMLAGDAAQLASSRGRAPGKPELNTYIMSDEVYAAFAAASVHGTIRLALPNLTEANSEPARVTSEFADWLAHNAVKPELLNLESEGVKP